MPELVHPTYKSNQTGINCGKVVTVISIYIMGSEINGYLGWKSDLSKYFDSVPIRYIDGAFDKVEARHGRSAHVFEQVSICNGYHIGIGYARKTGKQKKVAC